MKKYLLWCLALGFLFASFPAQAWIITPELKVEMAKKKTAVAKQPNSAYAHFDLAITYAYTNHIQEGWNELKKAEELDASFRTTGLELFLDRVINNPQDWRLRFRLAFAYYFNNEKEAAIRELKNALIIDPYNVWAYGYIALIYGELDKIDAAMEYTRRGLKIDSNVAALHLLLSEGHYKKGDGWNGFLERMEALRLRALGY